MVVLEILEHFHKLGTWVNWDDTCDRILYGNSEMVVKGIAVSWIATNSAIKKAGEEGLNLFITHEPSFYNFGYPKGNLFQDTLEGKKLINEKKKLLDEFGITLIRCHDLWDRMPVIGICDAWADFLGFETEKRPIESFYKVCLINNLSLSELSVSILKKIKLLGQDSIKVMGNENKKIKRMVIGTGAITVFNEMYKLNPDVILATEDGMHHWDAGLFAIDLNIPFIIVNHAIAEIPGIKALAEYLKNYFNQIPVKYINTFFPYKTFF